MMMMMLMMVTMMTMIMTIIIGKDDDACDGDVDHLVKARVSRPGKGW